MTGTPLTGIDLTPAQMEELDRMVECVDQDDLYGLLRVGPDADANAIQKAYYELSRSWHPDRFFRKKLGEYGERLETAFVGVTQAYKTLTDPVKRKNYDREHRARLEKRRTEEQEAEARAERQRRREERKQAEERGEVSTPPRTDAAPRQRSSVVRSSERTERRRDRDGPSIRERLAQNSQRRSGSSLGVTDRLRSRMMEQVREQVGERLRKARTFYEAGKADYEGGRILKAASNLKLALEFDPENSEYQDLYEKVEQESRKVRIISLVNQGEQAESYQQVKQAIQAYRDAVELAPTEGKVYFRLARLVRMDEGDDREALRLFREAVLRSPGNTEYRLGLGQLYKELGMRLNARREFQAVLDKDAGNAEARAAMKEL